MTNPSHLGCLSRSRTRDKIQEHYENIQNEFLFNYVPGNMDGVVSEEGYIRLCPGVLVPSYGSQ